MAYSLLEYEANERYLYAFANRLQEQQPSK